MQIVVWLVCAAGIALAVGVVHWKAARTRVELGPSQTVAGLEIRLPQGWMMKVERQAGIHVIRCAEQLQGGGFRRALIVLRQSVKSESDALEYLMTSVLSEDGGDDADAAAAEWISVDGHKGVVLEYQHRTPVGRTVHTEQRTAACVILDGGNAVVIQYVGGGDPYGKDLVRQIAQSMHTVDDAGDSVPSLPLPPLPVDGPV